MNAPLPASTVKFFGPLLPYAARARWDYCAIIAQLKARPGEWAEVGGSLPHGQANYLATRLRFMGCESRRRGAHGQPNTVYARWPEGKS